MGREVPFNPNSTCDGCGVKGAYDFMGDYFCQECLDQDASDFEKEALIPEKRGKDGI